jgi:hypothetical protein
MGAWEYDVDLLNLLVQRALTYASWVIFDRILYFSMAGVTIRWGTVLTNSRFRSDWIVLGKQVISKSAQTASLPKPNFDVVFHLELTKSVSDTQT